MSDVNKLLWALFGAGSITLIITLVIGVLSMRYDEVDGGRLPKYIVRVLKVLFIFSIVSLLFVSISWCYFDYWK